MSMSCRDRFFSLILHRYPSRESSYRIHVSPIKSFVTYSATETPNRERLTAYEHESDRMSLHQEVVNGKDNDRLPCGNLHWVSVSLVRHPPSKPHKAPGSTSCGCDDIGIFRDRYIHGQGETRKRPGNDSTSLRWAQRPDTRPKGSTLISEINPD
jgi:hypothetical protein